MLSKSVLVFTLVLSSSEEAGLVNSRWRRKQRLMILQRSEKSTMNVMVYNAMESNAIGERMEWIGGSWALGRHCCRPPAVPVSLGTPRPCQDGPFPTNWKPLSLNKDANPRKEPPNN